MSWDEMTCERSRIPVIQGAAKKHQLKIFWRFLSIVTFYRFINASQTYISVASEHLQMSEVYKHSIVATSRFLDVRPILLLRTRPFYSDRQTACDLKTALCTTVHRAVKTRKPEQAVVSTWSPTPAAGAAAHGRSNVRPRLFLWSTLFIENSIALIKQIQYSKEKKRKIN